MIQLAPTWTLSFFVKTLIIFVSRLLAKQMRRLKYHHNHPLHCKLQKHPFSSRGRNLPAIFDVEGFLLRSTSLFPYFMVVAFEAGGVFRAFLLLSLYPIICLLSLEMGIKVMVIVCFAGMNKERFRAGGAVLPKFFLEDVGFEGFVGLKGYGWKVGASVLPLEMVEVFLREYLGIDRVIGRRLKVVRGYFVGLMEENYTSNAIEHVDYVIGFCGFNTSLDHTLFSRCKEICVVSQAEKQKWSILPRSCYKSPLIFHDSRLALLPTPSVALGLFMWAPFGLLLALLRALITLALPRYIIPPILAFSGVYVNVQNTHDHTNGKRVLYVCNHKTLLDPLCLSFVLNRPLTAVTYSLSRVSEILSPIRTVRFRRDRDADAVTMRRLLECGDVAICPEGTTCREPYLLRFSPMFSEIGVDVMVPVAIDCHVCMFHGTTAGGLKCLDPLFYLMNPCPMYTVRLLDEICWPYTCGDGRFDVANGVQREIGKALGFECTMLTRKHKYLALTGNEGTSYCSEGVAVAN